MATEQDVLNALRNIMDPDLGRDIVSLGFIKDLAVDGAAVSFTLELTTPACPMKQKFREGCEATVKALPGVESVTVNITARQRGQAAPDAPNTLGTVNSVIAVSSCKGGVGKSTVAVHLARAMAADGLAVGLLDADIYGPSIPTLLNRHRPPVFAQDNKIVPVTIDGLKVMSLGFVLGESPAVMRGPMVSNYTQQILTQTDWGHLDYLIIDLPPGTGDIQLTIVQQTTLDGAIIVTTPQALSLVDVAKGILMFEHVHVPVLGIVENMSSFACPDCGAVHHPFGQSRNTLQERFGLPTLAELPISAEIADTQAETQPAFRAMAENVHCAVGKRRAEGDEGPQASVENGTLVVKWVDGSETRLPAYDVRCACPCALCRDENTGECTLDAATVPPDVSVERIQPLGHYAVSIAWSDGHATGIYSWDYLRRLGEQSS